MEVHDYIIVGSGLSGAMAAQTLVEAGADVLMLDVSYKNEAPQKFPDEDFLSIRRSSETQRQLFLGQNFEGIPMGNIKTGAQLTPDREYIVKNVDKYLGIASDTFFPMESLAYGGLGNAWGAGCHIYSDREFEQIGLNKKLFSESYQTVGDRIGISAGLDDMLKYSVEGLQNIMPALTPEENLQSIYRRYKKKKNALNKKGFYAGIPAVAILTRDKEERKQFSYKDMDFWHDNEMSVYRPWMTIDKLKKKQGFQLQENMLVTKFQDENDDVRVICKDVTGNEEKIFRCRKLILCCGALSTARIVLRSFNSQQTLPILSDAYVYVPMLNWRRLGSVPETLKSGMVQLAMFYDRKHDNSDVAMAAFFTYRSLLLFRLVKEAPLNFADGRKAIQYVVPAMVIAGIHHPEKPGNNKYVKLIKDDTSVTGDRLFVKYEHTDEEQQMVSKTESEYLKAFFQVGCIPIRKVQLGHGSSIHYAGTLPVSNKEDLFTTSENGRVNQTRNVYVADGSSFKYLPAKGISFTLMANADRVAKNVLSGKR